MFVKKKITPLRNYRGAHDYLVIRIIKRIQFLYRYYFPPPPVIVILYLFLLRAQSSGRPQTRIRGAYESARRRRWRHGRRRYRPGRRRRRRRQFYTERGYREQSTFRARRPAPLDRRATDPVVSRSPTRRLAATATAFRRIFISHPFSHRGFSFFDGWTRRRGRRSLDGAARSTDRRTTEFIPGRATARSSFRRFWKRGYRGIRRKRAATEFRCSVPAPPPSVSSYPVSIGRHTHRHRQPHAHSRGIRHTHTRTHERTQSCTVYTRSPRQRGTSSCRSYV